VFTMDCTNFADFTHAGNAVTEGGTISYTETNVGNSMGGVSENVPTVAAYDNPDFCTLGEIGGAFTTSNCATVLETPGAVSYQSGTPDNYTLGATGMYCTCGFECYKGSSVAASTWCETAWGGTCGTDPCAHVQMQQTHLSSNSAFATNLMSASDGVCWIDSINTATG
jgi:hypothetical protein